ncbi:hypothetical protein DOTSEDRAFT_33854 [Dothistroma septosporum NZE10]|uniref:Uncharacterized protein n=1 Tax=Dothistroma septosporum (strain NZE10 / CBS 128990) TaxID=675120 RepID=N1PSH6_DOTSN|nr:hypothetical protein DOTSEDRAFT_33854 [Dothistroma septosporum NZE10]
MSGTAICQIHATANRLRESGTNPIFPPSCVLTSSRAFRNLLSSFSSPRGKTHSNLVASLGNYYDPAMDMIDNNSDIFEELPTYESLHHGVTASKTSTDLAFTHFDSHFPDRCLPPDLNYFVRFENEPSIWKLLIGPSMTNATIHHNPDPLRKKRYRIVYPPHYEDVYLHKLTWAASADNLPRYHVELFGAKRYEPEPIVILGPTDHGSVVTNEAKNNATAYAPKVLSRIGDEVTQMTRFAVFCEMEYFSWDWGCKTAAAKQDMETLICKAKKQCVRTALLVKKLEKYVDYIEKTVEYAKALRVMRKSILEANIRLARLRL